MPSSAPPNYSNDLPSLSCASLLPRKCQGARAGWSMSTPPPSSPPQTPPSTLPTCQIPGSSISHPQFIFFNRRTADLNLSPPSISAHVHTHTSLQHTHTSIPTSRDSRRVTSASCVEVWSSLRALTHCWSRS